MEATENFDRWQFESNRTRAVSIDSEISFDDFQRMSAIKREARNPKYVPAWAMDDVKVRQVILSKLFSYTKRTNKTVPQALCEARASGDLRTLERHALSARIAPATLPWLSEPQRKIAESHLRATRNGLAGYWMRVLYLSYRLRMSSAQVAAEIGIEPPCVRGILHRLNMVARRLYPDDCNPPAPDPYAKLRRPGAAAKREHDVARKKANAKTHEAKNESSGRQSPSFTSFAYPALCSSTAHTRDSELDERRPGRIVSGSASSARPTAAQNGKVLTWL
jgi:hypothetical protein